ncbi:MAG: hypothetical protein ACRDID_05110, partial [Ktedonobacterales bacterium]
MTQSIAIQFQGERDGTDGSDAESDALRRHHAYFAFRLVAQASMTLHERLEAQTRLLGRYPMLCGATPGATMALELRVIVEPMHAAHNSTEPQIDVLLINRYSAWASSRADLFPQIRAFASDLSDTLHGSMPNFRFAAVAERSELAHALRPFTLADTVEFRRRPAQLWDAPLPLPFQGAPMIEALVDEMQRHDSATLLSICFTPEELDDGPLFPERYEP